MSYLKENGILFHNNKYKVFVRIQDGTEACGEYDNYEDASNSFIESFKILNGVDLNNQEHRLYKDLNPPPLFEWKPVVSYELVKVK